MKMHLPFNAATSGLLIQSNIALHITSKTLKKSPNLFKWQSVILLGSDRQKNHLWADASSIKYQIRCCGFNKNVLQQLTCWSRSRIQNISPFLQNLDSCSGRERVWQDSKLKDFSYSFHYDVHLRGSISFHFSSLGMLNWDPWNSRVRHILCSMLCERLTH